MTQSSVNVWGDCLRGGVWMCWHWASGWTLLEAVESWQESWVWPVLWWQKGWMSGGTSLGVPRGFWAVVMSECECEWIFSFVFVFLSCDYSLRKRSCHLLVTVSLGIKKKPFEAKMSVNWLIEYSYQFRHCRISMLHWCLNLLHHVVQRNFCIKSPWICT